MKKAITSALTLSALSIYLSGCAVDPQRVGISPEEWNSYSSSKKEQITERYHQAQEARELLIKQNTSLAQNQTINVSIQGGQVMMSPFRRAYAYEPIVFDIRTNECKNVIFKQVQGTKNVAVDACYLKQVLYLDPDFTDKSKALGSIRLGYMPLWARGFTYSGISSTGYARLSNVNIHVQTQ